VIRRIDHIDDIRELQVKQKTWMKIVMLLSNKERKRVGRVLECTDDSVHLSPMYRVPELRLANFVRVFLYILYSIHCMTQETASLSIC